MKWVKRMLSEKLKEKLKEWIVEGLKSRLEESSWLLKVLPFEKDRIRYDDCSCMGLTYNRGLLTQCEKSRVSDGSEYCRGCKSSLIGTVYERKEEGLYTYVDRKGHKVQQYLDVLKKLKISVEDVVAEASRLKITISSEHLKEKVVHRGRPKKEIVTREIKRDLFARVYLDEDVNIVDDVDIVEDVKDVVLVNDEKKRKRLSALEKKTMNDIYELKVEDISRLNKW